MFTQPKWFSKLALSAIVGLSFMACSPYSPEQMKLDREVQNSSSSTEQDVNFNGRIDPVNTGKQICNPSMSQDDENYPGSMLWLGFSGDLVVANPPKDYTISNVIQHDRLTISNQKNEVDWYMMMDEFAGVNCELQDPEWSTHPSYLVVLGAYNKDDACGQGMTHDGYVVRTLDKATILWKKNISNVSTPHVWIDPSAVADTSLKAPDSLTYDANDLVDAKAIEAFFGTSKVKFVYSEKVDGKLSIFMVDYSSSSPKPIALTKPLNKEDYNCESAMISPDGRWVTYNVYKNVFQYSAYMQPLSSNQSLVEPIAVSETGSDPHWFAHPTNSSQMFVTYVELGEDKSYKVLEDLQDPEVLEKASAGSTWKREVFIDLPENTSAETVLGKSSKIIDLPMKGGRSPSGDYMCTGTNLGYIVELF